MAPQSTQSIHIVMFPIIVFGRVSPFIQLSNMLSYHGVRISFLTIPGFIPRVQNLLTPSPNSRIIPLHIPPTILGLSPDVAGTADLPPSEAVKLITIIDHTQPQIKSILADLKPHFVFFNFAQHWLLALASEIGIKTLYFSVFSAITKAYMSVPERLTAVVGHAITQEDLTEPPSGFPMKYYHGNRLIKTFEARTFLFVFELIEGSPSNYDRVLEGMNGCSAIV
ncbi:inactive UDP-glycosyltransferase 79A6-like [Humulus lupulus]|uniref:inactive UDP-glycosyltransferase 79A6-like n=1 Tax=Humulus lupulus TaxID=3486 RepID=UPI002B417733|nr:inactive UDP-glycosyltransferase 79A6-like [Humulus lupulus]